MNQFYKISYCLSFLLTFNFVSTAQYVTLEGKQFKDENGANFYPMVMNYLAGIACDNASNPSTFKVIRSIQIGTTGSVLEPVDRYYDLAHCEQSLEDDFEKLKLMGFNTVRFLLAPNRNDILSQAGGFNKTAEVWSTSDMSSSGTYTLNFTPFNYNCTNCDAEKYFNLIAHLLDIAQAHQIKVIFLCADHSEGDYPEMGSSPADAADYANYLSALATALKEKPALLAYDLYNEPNYQIYNLSKNMAVPKQTICQYVGDWYDAIKDADPNHLVTIGGTDMGDVLDWDPGVMKIDFVSMHPYSIIKDPSFPSETLPMRIEKTLNLISWFGSAFSIPWIIGETGFAASDETCLQPYLWGNDIDQKNYVEAILPAIRDCGGSGFSWWDFQDKHWFCIPGEVCNPDINPCNYCDSWSSFGGSGPGNSYCGHSNQSNPNDLEDAKNILHGNYYGLLKYGDPDATGMYDALAVDKPAVMAISSFNPTATASCIAPTPYYYNPHQYPSSSGTLSGTITDQNGTPINNAFIVAHTTITPDPLQGLPFPRLEYTFTDANGVFQLIPAPDPHTVATTIKDVRVGAYGAESKFFGFPLFPPFPTTYNLSKIQLDYDKTISATILSGTQNYSAWNSITTSNFMVQSGASSDLTAREEINVTTEFHAAAGSEVHIYTSKTFPDCSDYSGYANRVSNTTSSPTNSSAELPKEIEVTFTKPLPENFLSVIPNPSKGKFLVRLITSDANAVIQHLSIYDLLGKQIYYVKETTTTITIDLTTFSKGIYYLKANDAANSFYKKIIIN